MNNFKEANKKIENAVVSGYQAIEDGVVSGYKAIENSAVTGYKKIEKKFVDAFLTPEGETEKQETIHQLRKSKENEHEREDKS